ncbi:MAG: CinA family protein [Anaerolineae bacterium]|nr:CinA family protein [Anaerolineae bacterium]
MESPEKSALEVVVGQLLRRHGLTLAVAESCTGGLVSHRITDVPGSSVYYQGAVVSYSNEIKERALRVRRGTLERYGAVSEQVAREMAQGVRNALCSDIGLAVTGVAGPDGGTPEKPVGLVYVALAAPDGAWVERHVWQDDQGDHLDRWENKASSAEAVLDLLRRYLEGQL